MNIEAFRNEIEETPRKNLMTWIQARRHWRKIHKKKVYTVSCEELGTDGTKDDSWQEANEWWLDMVRQLGQQRQEGEDK